MNNKNIQNQMDSGMVLSNTKSEEVLIVDENDNIINTSSRYEMVNNKKNIMK